MKVNVQTHTRSASDCGSTEDMARKLRTSNGASKSPPKQCANTIPAIQLKRGAYSLDLGDRKVHVLFALEHPRVIGLEGLLSDDECSALIEAATVRMSRSLTVESASCTSTAHVARTSFGMFFQRGENIVVQRVEERIARLVSWPVERGEGLQVLNYQAGAQYLPHYDYFDPAASAAFANSQCGGQRVATVVVYLNDPIAGGETSFPQAGLVVAPRRGNAVFFSYPTPSPETKTLHGGEPIVTGEKWVATKWLRQGRVP